jgi:hypothetical protein
VAVTRADARALDAQLDWNHPVSLESLLPPRDSGRHELVRAGLLHGTGATESLSGAMLGRKMTRAQARRCGAFNRYAGSEVAERKAAKQRAKGGRGSA